MFVAADVGLDLKLCTAPAVAEAAVALAGLLLAEDLLTANSKALCSLDYTTSLPSDLNSLCVCGC